MNTQTTIREVRAEVFIPLTKGQVAVVDFDDWNNDLRNYKWFAKWCKYHKQYVAARSEYDPELYRKQGDNHNRTVLMHRQIAAQMGLSDVDHKNLNTLDNRRENLRPCTRSQNVANSKKRIHNTSGFKGVHWNTTSKAWAARIGVEGKRIFLGYFNTPEEAAQAYDAAAKKYFGEFSRLNEAPQPENTKPRTPHHNTSGFPGVSLEKTTGKWRARLTVGSYKRVSLGLFDTAEQAAQAIESAKKRS